MPGLAPPPARDDTISRSRQSPTRDFRFEPDVGPWNHEILRLARRLSQGDPAPFEPLREVLAEVLDGSSDQASRVDVSTLRFAFAVSLLRDILQLGGVARVIDSTIFVSWPDWTGPEGRQAVGIALQRARRKRPLSEPDRRVLRATTSGPMPARQALDFLRFGTCWLEPTDAVHPSGVGYGDIFALALRHWKMPYGSREGRSRRFVLVGKGPDSPQPLAIGLIEVGDDAPYSTERDRFLTLRSGELLTWLASRSDGSNVAHRVAEHFARIRAALLPVSGMDTTAPAGEVVARRAILEELAGGRSRLSEDLVYKKRISYLLRLAHGEVAFAAIARGEAVSTGDLHLREGLRAMHNLVVPRLHMEATVCGALPPFSAVLGGKLTASFLAHPTILEAAASPPGTIVRSLFDEGALVPEMPRWGILAMTTRGLYPGHSAQYNRAAVPGIHGPVGITKIGETSGETTTVLSTDTARLAQLLVGASGEQRQVSATYGSGGAKRLRAFESAATAAGMPQKLVHAGIRRPVYGLRLVRNLPEVIWAGDLPEWAVGRKEAPESYSEVAVALWRERWLPVASRRPLPEVLPGLLTMLENGPE